MKIIRKYIKGIRAKTKILLEKKDRLKMEAFIADMEELKDSCERAYNILSDAVPEKESV